MLRVRFDGKVSHLVWCRMFFGVVACTARCPIEE